MSHRRAARFAAITVAVSSGLLTALATTMTASPARADAPGSGGGAGCTGQSCWVSMQSQYIHLSGDYTNGPTSYGTVPVPPPPCWMTPLLSGPEMYQIYQQSRGQRVGPNGQDPWASYRPWISQIIKNRNPPGTWYVPEMWGTSAGFACGAKLPLLAWVPPGAAPPAPPIPPATLAAYAYDHLRVPSPALVVNPAGRNYVSLPTYVWATQPGGGAMPRRLWIAASAGGNSVTLTATTRQLSISTSDGTARLYSPCPPTGSTYPVGQPPRNSGPGTAPDCGLTFSTSSTAATISASLTYTINVTGVQIGFYPITVTGGKTVSVAEIQNLNG
jgi:hypothetical protein